MDEILQTCSGRWRPRRGIHVALVGDDLVVLDVGAGRYACLPDAARAVERAAGGVLRIGDDEVVRDLEDSGLVEAAEETLRPWEDALEMPVPPQTTAVPGRAGCAHFSDVPEIAACLLDAARAYRGRSLAKLVAAARRSRPASGPQDVTALVETASRFHRWIPYAPVPAKCLLRSFMLLRLLHRRGLDAAWVFGVANWPFRAHCWLQAGDMALDDYPERLRAFTPIMVV